MADTIIDLVTADELGGELADIYEAIAAAKPADYDTVKSQVQQNTQAITGIEAKIPAQASAQNQLADKAFVNSSIQTNTATFRGTYNLVTDLGLTVSATEEQVATAIATHLASLVPPVVPENNDYVFVQIPRETSDPTVVVRYDRYKCSVTEAGGTTTRTWAFEYSLNNSSFTADQWAAINSGITSGDVAKIQLIDTLVARGYIGFQNGGNKVLAISGEQLTAYKTVSRRTTSPATTYPDKIGLKFNLKEFVAYCLSAADDPIGKSTIDQVQLNGSAKLDLYFPITTTADFVRIGVYTSSTATTPVSVSEAQLIGSLGTITEYTFEFSSQQYLTADATYYFRIEDDSGTAIPCYIYASDKFTGFSWAFINSDGTAGSDISSTMPDLQLGCNIKTYYTIELEAKDLVALENFSQQKTYAQGQRVVYNNDLYEVKAGGHAAGAWNGNHFKKLFSIGSNLTIGDAEVEKRATSSVWPSPSGNIVAGQNGATASGANNIVFGYGAEARNRNASSLTDTTMNNIVLGNAARVINDLLASARKPTTDTTAVADAVYFGYGAKYSSAATYANQSYCSYGYGIYQCTSAISSPEVWNPAHWSLKDALDYDATKTYAVGDVCKHSGSLYTCSTAIDTPKDWDVDDWTYVSLGEFQEGAMVSLTTSAGSTLPQNDYLQIYIAPAGYLTGISRAILLGAFSVIRASGGIGIGNDLTVNDPDATVIGNGATSHGAKSLNFAATELIKVFLGDANLVDLINQAVADQMIKAAVSAEVTQTRSTPTATRKLLALNPANPTGEKTEVTAADIGALGNTGDQNLDGSLSFWNDILKFDFEDAVLNPVIRLFNGLVRIAFPLQDGTLALTSQIYEAVRNIAPDFTAKTYVVNELCSYNGVVYRCKSVYTATAQSTKPSSDTTHWEAKKVSELFLGNRDDQRLTGGTLLIDNNGPDTTLHLTGIQGDVRIENWGGEYRAGASQQNPDARWYWPGVSSPEALARLYDVMRFSENRGYTIGDIVFYNGGLYRCVAALHSGAWDDSSFELVLGGLSTGAPTAPTPTTGDDSTKVATTAFVQTAVAGATPNLDYVMRVNPETGEIYYTTPDANA